MIWTQSWTEASPVVWPPCYTVWRRLVSIFIVGLILSARNQTGRHFLEFAEVFIFRWSKEGHGADHYTTLWTTPKLRQLLVWLGHGKSSPPSTRPQAELPLSDSITSRVRAGSTRALTVLTWFDSTKGRTYPAQHRHRQSSSDPTRLTLQRHTVRRFGVLTDVLRLQLRWIYGDTLWGEQQTRTPSCV